MALQKDTCTSITVPSLRLNSETSNDCVPVASFSIFNSWSKKNKESYSITPSFKAFYLNDQEALPFKKIEINHVISLFFLHSSQAQI